jgi:putative acetyltransferase
MQIVVDDLRGPEIAELLRTHLQDMALSSPPESVHALDLEALRKPEVTFWSVWQDGELMGCGAIKELDSRHGEIKSMRTVSSQLRKGVAATLMRHILDEAKRRSYERLEPRNRLDRDLRAGAKPLCELRIHAMRAVCRLHPRSLQRLHDPGNPS